MRIFLTAFLATCLTLAGTPAVFAQDPSSLDQKYDELLTLQREGKNKEGLEVVDAILKRFGKRGFQRYGPVFGHFYFLKGLFQLAEKDYEGAAESFRICHTDYGNKGPLARKAPNALVDEAIIQQAGALMMLKKYDEAAELYNTLNRAGIGAVDAAWNADLNKGVAMLRAGKLEEGHKYFTDGLRNPNLALSKKVDAFQQLVLHWSPRTDLKEVYAFVEEFGGLMLAAGETARYASADIFFSAAREAFDKKDLPRASLWLGFVPSQPEATSSAEAKDTPASEGADAAEALKNDRLVSRTALKGVVQLQLGNPFGAISAFQYLLAKYPDNPQAANLWYNLALAQVGAGRSADALESYNEFESKFGDHELRGPLELALVEPLLVGAEYERALTIADRILAAPESENKETAQYVKAVALYQLGKLTEADAALDAYFTEYGMKGKRSEQVGYYRGAAKLQLNRPDDAAHALQEYIVAFPDSPLTPGALQLQAGALTSIGKYKEALDRTERIGEKFGNSPESAQALVLRGELLAAEGTSSADLIAIFSSAREAAAKISDQQSDAQAMKNLISIAAGSNDDTQTIALYDEYFQKYAGGTHDVPIVMASSEALERAGRGGEISERLRAALINLGDTPSSEEMGKITATLADVSGETPDQRIAALNKFRESNKLAPSLQGWILITEIEELESLGDKAPTRQIDDLFRKLETGFSPDQLNNYVTVRIARWLSSKGRKDESLALYKSIIDNRADAAGSEYALVDLATMQVEEGQELEQALENFRKVAETSEDQRLVERSRLGIARIASSQKNWPEAEKAWTEYLANRGWSLARAEANYRLAEAIDQLGDQKKATGLYVSVYNNFAGHLDFSTPAYLRTAEILNEQGKKREALKVLQDMLKRMSKLEHPNIDKAKGIFQQWRDEYVQNSQTQ